MILVVGSGVVSVVVALAISVGHSQYGAVSYDVEQLAGGGIAKHGFSATMRRLMISVKNMHIYNDRVQPQRCHIHGYLDYKGRDSPIIGIFLDITDGSYAI